MSQNKTVIQGLEPADNNFGSSPMGGNQSFYTRGNRPAARGTVVPGMMEAQANQPSQPEAVSSPQQPRRTVQPGKPVVGFLYSVSRTAVGEFWPLQIGRNTIGQSAECDIVLAEATVSSNHAVIVIRQGKNGIIAAIKDPESTNGTFINGERIDFEAEECHSGDVITIGNNYQLIFILVDAGKYGLTPNKEFISIDVEDTNNVDDDIPTFTPGSTRPGGFDPYNDGPTSWGNGGGFSPAGGTVGMDGSMSGGNHGGTVPM